MSANLPRIVIAGTHSGVGKTSLVLGLVAALGRRGVRVQTYKVGPDFLDPSYLALASGRPCYNLDGWMAGKDYVRKLFDRTARGADLAVIEGVMGLFDGAEPATEEGSTAEIARWLQAPVLLVGSGHGLARSFAALVQGYTRFAPDLPVAGVLANQCGSAAHGEWLSQSLTAASQPPLMGAFPRGVLPELPSRHLGLVTADPGNLSPQVLEALGSAFEVHADLEKIIRLARSAPPWQASFAQEPAARHAGLRIGVARDAAFHFYYQDLFDELQRRGCETASFSPIGDTRLPENCSALYIGGGYPEEHAAALSANAPMLSEIRRFAAAGGLIYAECGGLMYLSRELETAAGRHAMAGLLPVGTRMLATRRALGYVEVALREDSLWGPRGALLRGHEFHYSEMTAEAAGKEGWRALYSLTRRRNPEVKGEGLQRGRVLASYVHLHLASRPQALNAFVAHCGGHGLSLLKYQVPAV